MDNESRITLAAVATSAVELAGALVAQGLFSASVKTAASGLKDLAAVQRLVDVADGYQIITANQAASLSGAISLLDQAALPSPSPADCEALKQAVESSPLADFVAVACNAAAEVMGTTLDSVVEMVRNQLINGGEHLLGGLRMAGLMGLASIFLNRVLTDRINENTNNEFLARIAAQAVLALGSATVNSFVLAPLAKLSLSGGEFGRDLGIGLMMGTAVVLGEILTRQLTDFQIEEMGPAIGVFSQAIWRARGVALTLPKLIGFF